MRTIDSPAALREALQAVACNLWFSWLQGARDLFEQLDPQRFEALDHNPTALLADLSDEELWERAPRESVERVLDELERERSRSTWWERRDEDEHLLVPHFSCEFGLGEALTLYYDGP